VAGILLIEDDAAARHLLRVLLERDSHTVWEAASPDEGWSVLEETATPDLAIVDLRLGEATGIDLMRRLRADAIWAALPVVLCSATPDRESVLSSVQLGAAAFLTKPYDALRIRAAVGKALATKWTRKHFEDPVSVTRRLSTDRDHVAQLAKKFFSDLQAATKVVIETEEERKTALVHLVGLHRTAAELGLHSIEPALAEWENAGGGQAATPALIRRIAVLARLFVVHGL
jgi:two-component system chemotaxis response regulator CheY